jgi:DNA segregation ATPase FtsK/SpoIIIE-like protein
MSDKPSEERERPRSSIFGSRSDDKKDDEKKPEERPSPFGSRPPGSIFGKPSGTSTFGRPTPMPPKPATSTGTGSTPKPPEPKPASSIFGTRTAETPKVEEPPPKPEPAPKLGGAAKPEEKKGGLFGGLRRPSPESKPEDKPADAPKPAESPKPEEKKGGLFGGLRRPSPESKPEDKPADAPKPAAPKLGNILGGLRRPPAETPKPEDKPAATPKPEEKKGGGIFGRFGRGKKAEDKPAEPVDAPKIGVGKPADKPAESPRGGFLGIGARKPAEPPKEPPAPKPEAKKPEAAPQGGVLSRLFGRKAPKEESGAPAAPIKTPAPVADPKRGGSSIPGAPPARGEKQAKPLEGQTHVTVKNTGLSLDQKLDIVGYLLMGTGLVMIFGLIQPDEGTFTKAIVDIFGALFGYGRYIIPVVCLMVGGWLFVRHFKENPFLAFDTVKMTGSVLLFLSAVTWLHTIELIDKVVYDWDELIAVSARAVDLMQGGGWVGDRLYMILIRLTGEFGVPIVLTITTLVGVMWLFDLSLAEVATYIKSFFQLIGARIRRIRESWRLWRHSVAAKREARRAAHEQKRAEREAAKLAAQSQVQPQPQQTPSLPAAATLAYTSDLPQQPMAVPIGAEAKPSARKAAFRAPVTAPAVPSSEPPVTGEDTPPPAPSIAKPPRFEPRSTQSTPFKPVAEAAPAPQTESPPPPERAKTGAFGKPKSAPVAPSAEPETARTEDSAPVESPKPPERAKTGLFSSGKPKSAPVEPPEPEAAKAEDSAPVESPKPPERAKTGAFRSIFGAKPKSAPVESPSVEPEPPKVEDSAPVAESAPSAETTSPAASTAPVESEPPDLSVTQPTRATSIFSTVRPAPKPSGSIFGAKPKAETSDSAPSGSESAEDDMPTAKAPPPPAKPSSSIFGSRASSPFGSPSVFRPAPKPSDMPPQSETAADEPEDELEAEADALPEPVERTAAPMPRISGIATSANGSEASPAELPPMQLPDGETSWTMPDYRQLLRAGSAQNITQEMLLERARIIEQTLESFGAPGRVVEINVGPAITQFGVEPGYLNARGKQTRIKVNQIAKLDNDLALALAARSIRIEAPVPGKGYVGIEVPNPETSLVGLRDIIASPTFNEMRSRLRLALGKSIDGAAVVADLTQMPHLLIAGTTGSGKSVCVNAIIACLLLQNSPDDLKLVMVDPKRVELAGYNGIPHLVSPVVVDLERVTGVLKWVTREMDDRYRKFAALGARNISDYNTKIGKSEPRMPYLVVIVDELADLMMLAPDETEKQLTRLAQMARATGIHLIISTQRPSVDVVTGLIKANFPARISFAVASSVDSRVILDQPGAEKLLGRGDMLFQAPDAAAPIRVQGVYVSDAELKQITDFWKNAQKERGTPISHVSFDHAPDKPTAKLVKPGESSPFQSRTERFGGSSPFGAPRSTFQRPPSDPDEEKFFAALRDDPPKESKVDEALYERAVELYKQSGTAFNVTLLQRRLNVDYTQAQALYKLMRERGVFKADNGDNGADA